MGLFGNRRSNDAPLDPFDKSTWSFVERLYFQRVDTFFENEVGDQFKNGNAAHAVYLIAKFFQKAADEVRIFSGSLTKRASNGVQIYENPNLIEAAQEFSRKGGEIRIVVENDIDGGKQEHPLVQSLWNEERCHIVKARGDTISFLRERNFLHHMMVMDATAWRVETKSRFDDRGSLKSVQALVSVHDEDGAASLKNLFDTVLFNNGTALTPR